MAQYTVQQYLDSLSGAPYQNITGGSEAPQYSTFGDAGLTLEQMLGTSTPLFGGMTPRQHLSGMGVTDPMNQLNFRLPEATGSLMPSSTDMGGFALAFGPLLAMAGPTIMGTAAAGGAEAAGGLSSAAAGGSFVPVEAGFGLNTGFGMQSAGQLSQGLASGLAGAAAGGGGGGGAEMFSPNLTASGNAAAESTLAGLNGLPGVETASTGLFGMPWSTLSSMASLGTGLVGLGQTGNIASASQADAARLDPFGPYRGEFANQLMGLMADPSLIEKKPGYRAGLRAVQRALAAQGFNPGKGGTPGNWTYAMDKFGGEQYAAEFARLAAGAGMNIAPGGGAINTQGQVMQTQLMGQALQSIIAGIRGLAS